MTTPRTKGVAQQWRDMCTMLEETAILHDILYRELPPKVFGDPALCSIITGRKHLSLMLHADGELRITYKALPSYESLVCNILDVQSGYVRQLTTRFP